MRSRLIFLFFFIGTITVLVTGFSPVTELKVTAPAITSKQWINSEPLDWDKLKG
ncbi:hypothetical protein [Kaarinaea lacus]